MADYDEEITVCDFDWGEQVKLIDPLIRGCHHIDRVSCEAIINISDAVQGIFEYG